MVHSKFLLDTSTSLPLLIVLISWPSFLQIRRTSGSFEYPPILVNVPAGGYIDLGGGDTPEEATIDVFDSNNQPFNYQWKTDHQAGYT